MFTLSGREYLTKGYSCVQVKGRFYRKHAHICHWSVKKKAPLRTNVRHMLHLACSVLYGYAFIWTSFFLFKYQYTHTAPVVSFYYPFNMNSNCDARVETESILQMVVVANAKSVKKFVNTILVLIYSFYCRAAPCVFGSYKVTEDNGWKNGPWAKKSFTPESDKFCSRYRIMIPSFRGSRNIFKWELANLKRPIGSTTLKYRYLQSKSRKPSWFRPYR